MKTLVARWPTMDVSRAKCYYRHPYICFETAAISGLIACVILATFVRLHSNFFISHPVCFKFSWHTFHMLRTSSSQSESMKVNSMRMTKVLIVQVSAKKFCPIHTSVCLGLSAEWAIFSAFRPQCHSPSSRCLCWCRSLLSLLTLEGQVSLRPAFARFMVSEMKNSSHFPLSHRSLR